MRRCSPSHSLEDNGARPDPSIRLAHLLPALNLFGRPLAAILARMYASAANGEPENHFGLAALAI